MERKLRARNFYAGPSALPTEVLTELKETIASETDGAPAIVETSHRSDLYLRLHEQTIELIRELLEVPEEFHVLLLAGGATLQFAMVPMNLIHDGGASDAVISGHWARRAATDAGRFGEVNVLFDGEDSGYSALPNEVTSSSGSAYVHITTNETINGVQWKRLDLACDAPIVADMSSDLMSRPIPVNDFGLIYGSAQKNLGIAGVTVVIINRELDERCNTDLPDYLSYRTHSDKNSLYNTPPVIAVYSVKLFLEWVKRQGGVVEMARQSESRSGVLYDAIARSGGFYRAPVKDEFRSHMNVVWTLPEPELEERFLLQCEGEGMVGLRGHRSVGGVRASLYNGQPVEWAVELAELMDRFAERNG